MVSHHTFGACLCSKLQLRAPPQRGTGVSPAGSAQTRTRLAQLLLCAEPGVWGLFSLRFFWKVPATGQTFSRTDHLYRHVLVGWFVGFFCCFGCFFSCKKRRCLPTIVEGAWKSLAVCPGVECPALSHLPVQQLRSWGWMHNSALAFCWLQRPPVTIDLMMILTILKVISSTSGYRKLTPPTQGLHHGIGQAGGASLEVHDALCFA